VGIRTFFEDEMKNQNRKVKCVGCVLQ